jgi:small-conductance mechanosensitive channel
MPFLRYDDHEVRKLLSRIIPIRWPEEGLLFVTECLAERSLGESDVSNESERGGWRYYDCHPGDRRGFLAATKSRLIYQDRVTPGSVIMALALVIGAFSVALLVFGHNLLGWLVMTTVALAVWTVGRIVEAGTAATIDVEFDNIVRLEAREQRMVAVGRRHTVLSLHISDPSDFRMVAALVSGLGYNAA